MLRNLLLGGAVLLTPTLSFAQDTNQDTDEDIITVNATRLNQTTAEVGSAVSIITASDIEALGYDFLIDALEAVPGVSVSQNGPFGGTATVRIRGAASEQTLTLIDGVPVNDTASPGGGFDFSRLDTDAIERIEVIKGAASTLWGSDAIGGVVNIITKRAEDGLHANAFAEYGSFDTKRGGASISGANDTGDIRIGITAIDSDGISKADSADGNTEKDGYASYSASARGGLNLGPARLEGSVIYTDAKTEFDGFAFTADRGFVLGDVDNVTETEELSAQITAKLPLVGGRLENMLMLGYSELSRNSFSSGVAGFSASGERNILRYQGTGYINERNTLGFGYEREETEAGVDKRGIDSLFALLESKPIDRLTITGGIRHDDHSVFGGETTLRASAAYALASELTLRGSWGQGFKAPTLFQTSYFVPLGFGASPEPDPTLAPLLPETSNSYDIGFDFTDNNGRTRFGMSAFTQDVENLIDFTTDLDRNAFLYRNLAFTGVEGLEVYGDHDVTNWLNIAASYSYMDARDGDGQQRLRIPEHSADVTLGFSSDGPLSGAVTARYVGDLLDSAGPVDGWLRFDAAANYALSDRVEYYGRVQNILDNDYQQLLGYGTPGISGSLGVRLRY